MAIISTERNSTALGPAITSVVENLHADRQRIKADRKDAALLNTEQTKAYRQQIEIANSQLKHLNDQIELLREKIMLQQDIVEKIEPLLSKGYISIFQHQQHKASKLEAQSELKSLLRQRGELSQQIATSEAKIRQLPLQLSARLSELDAQQSATNQSLARTEIDREIFVTAPEKGQVSAIHLKEGQSTEAGQALATLVPENSRLVARLLVKSNAIGFVKPGVKVALHLKAFPYQKFGIQKGIVKHVSHSALSSEEVAALLRQKQVEQEPLYQVEVDLQSQTITAYGRKEELRPGMAVEADLLLDRRHLVEWLFEPLLGARERWKG
ncbi:HlyD family efflux transporter periplasmic adaptor subunit [Luteibacter yeojuensis]|uniref:HlyD family efflux transporter periplasmic adaptor subunit n=1 Tax=Luteibacter yeojuensis TaxID=345309 RepID=A0A7X5TP08_9GAMM|nr:HlyD family efflux transporter periplasmic adaptor subunit [Luteibacter yeojuensis]